MMPPPRLAAALCALLLLPSGAQGWSRPPDTRSPGIAVTLVAAARRDLVQLLPVTGQLVARREVPVASRAAGLSVMQVLVEEGDSVDAGQPLVLLDASVLMAQHARARAALAEAEANAREAQLALRRIETIRGSGAVSAELLDQRRAQAAVAAARVAAAQAELGEVAVRVEQATLRAPVAGRVLRREVQVGAVVQSDGQPLLRLAADDAIEFEARVPDHALPGLSPGLPVEVRVGDGPPLAGAVRAVAPRVDPQTRLGLVQVALPPDPVLRPGAFATGTLRLAQARDALVVPTAAVVTGVAGSAVAVVGDDRIARRRAVATGIRADGLVEVREGLREGERVVARAVGLLRDGEAVAIAAAAREARR